MRLSKRLNFKSLRKSRLHSLPLDKPPGFANFCEPGQSIIKGKKSVLTIIAIQLEDVAIYKIDNNCETIEFSFFYLKILVQTK